MDNYNKYENVAYIAEDKANRLVEFLNYSGIKDVACEFNDLSGLFDVSVPTKDYEMAKSLYQAFEYNEDNQEAEDITDTSDVNLYSNTTEKYKDNLSTAITFFICGGAGLIILLLNDFGILKFITPGTSSFILTNIVLGLVFAAFIVIGVLSLKYSKKIKNQAASEENAKAEVMDWLRDNIKADVIEASYSSDIPDEMKYFNRSDFVKEAITSHFTDIKDEKIIEVLSDSYIEELFN